MLRSAGFSIVELMVAVALTLTLAGTIFSLTQSSHGLTAAQGEIADLQQRSRVAVDIMSHHLGLAGAGAYIPDHAGPLNAAIPAVFPFRRGTIDSDPPGTVRSDAITVLYVPTTAAQTLLTADAAPGSQVFEAARVPVCPAGVNLCGFAPGTTVLVFDAAGAFQIFTIAAVDDGARALWTTMPASAPYLAGTPVVEVSLHTYALKLDPVTHAQQLVHSTGTTNADLPVLDHLVALGFDYDVPPNELGDGPWRPDAASADRWDADLLRIRTIGVTIRLESAVSALRGPAGPLFANRGTASDPRLWVVDQQVHFQITPRNLRLTR